MKKNLLMTWVFLGVVSFAGGQEKTIEPGQQAKNYLNSKNASVDYATGIFNYRVPVHEIKVGDFTLPVTLDYAARGVKADDHPGAVGYNWNLNAGGVVTRQLRGGIADETQNYGYVHREGMIMGPDGVYTVYVGKVDGEADIFTAVFNGRSVNFIIRYQEYASPHFFALPLEPTNLKIKCRYALPSTIYGWEITDEEGNKYVFEADEWCSTTRSGVVEASSVKDVNYISSWYLSYVQPVNTPLISYEYMRDSVLGQSILTRTTVDYRYGRPVIEHPYDFSKYKERFDAELRIARQYFSWENEEIYNNCLHQNALYNSLDDFYLNASLDEIYPERIMQNQYMMGMLYDLGFVHQAYQEVIDLLDYIISDCSSHASSYYAREAILHLNSAKALVTACRDEEREVRQKDVYQFGRQDIATPMLKKISWDSGELEFKYSRRNYLESFFLDKIIVRDVNRDSIRSVRLDRDYPDLGLLREISFHDRSGEKVSNILFDYYRMGTSRYMVNLFGYYLEYSGDGTSYEYINKQRFRDEWNDGVLHNSLREICVPGEVVTELEYGSNTCNIPLNGYCGNQSTGAGIRLSAIRIKDGVSGKTDEVYYDYPECGVYVYPEFTNLLVIDYPSGFQDELFFDRLYNPGPDAIVKTGNNGVYYPRVVEYMSGKGVAEYCFAMPDTSNVTCNYHATGNPLGICYYDERGKLKKVIRYEYDDTSALATRKYLYQVKPCAYFVDEERFEWKYDSLYFNDNLRPRLKPIYPSDPYYQIDYDYAIYLKRVTEYNFEGNVPYFDGLNYLRESPNYTRTEYDYDLSRSVFPVKTTVSGGDGIKQVEVVKRALDFDDGADASIPLLKAANMVGVPLKVQTFTVDADGTEQLLSERVNTYVNFGNYYFVEMLQTEANEYIYDGESVVRADSLFSFDRSKYDRTVLTYAEQRGLWLPVSVESLGNRTETRYDFETGFPVLQVANAPANSVAACDYRRFKGMYYRPEMALTPVAAGKYRLWVLTMASVPITLSITSGGTVSTRTFTAVAGCLGPQVFELELAAGAEKVCLTNPDANLVYIAIVPAGCEMEATSYNADGTVYCIFDHNGRAERYEYDAAGRVVKTFDRDGNLLKENSYNVVF